MRGGHHGPRSFCASTGGPRGSSQRLPRARIGWPGFRQVVLSPHEFSVKRAWLISSSSAWLCGLAKWHILRLYTYIYIYTHIYVERERNRNRERHIKMYIYICVHIYLLKIHTYTHIYIYICISLSLSPSQLKGGGDLCGYSAARGRGGNCVLGLVNELVGAS